IDEVGVTKEADDDVDVTKADVDVNATKANTLDVTSSQFRKW
ncbi:13508_t:CDS:2, partial [Cetraspora pellucida]